MLKYKNSFGSAGHVHPDAASFSLFGNGRFLIRNPGYSMKRTSYQNTLLVNGKGQVGEHRWFRYTPTASSAIREANTKMYVISHAADADYLIADAATAYDTSLGLKVFRRHLVFLKDISALLVFDEIELAHRGDLTLSFHPEIPATALGKPNILLSRDEHASLFIQPLSPQAKVVLTAADTLLSTGGKPYFLPSVKIEYPDVKMMNSAVLLNWHEGNLTPSPLIVKVDVSRSGIWKLLIDGKGTLVLDPGRRKMNWLAIKTKK